jgi:hypothetical protein
LIEVSQRGAPRRPLGVAEPGYENACARSGVALLEKCRIVPQRHNYPFLVLHALVLGSVGEELYPGHSYFGRPIDADPTGLEKFVVRPFEKCLEKVVPPKRFTAWVQYSGFRDAESAEIAGRAAYRPSFMALHPVPALSLPLHGDVDFPTGQRGREDGVRADKSVLGPRTHALKFFPVAFLVPPQL